jgi:hypothetical protein
MGFNKLWLPEVDALKESLMKLGNEEFSKYWKRRYNNADAIIGSEASSEFIKQFINMEYNEHITASKKATK